MNAAGGASTPPRSRGAAPGLVGRLLRNRRANPGRSVWEKLVSDGQIAISSPSFADGEPMPERHAGPGVGENVSPALTWQGVPAQADHLIFVLEDQDVPFPTPLIHTMTILDPRTSTLAEGALGAGGDLQQLKGLLGTGYSGPRPIVGHGPHHYRFMLFAVQGPIDTTSQKAVVRSSAGHVLARGRLTGTYER